MFLAQKDIFVICYFPKEADVTVTKPLTAAFCKEKSFNLKNVFQLINQSVGNMQEQIAEQPKRITFLTL